MFYVVHCKHVTIIMWQCEPGRDVMHGAQNTYRFATTFLTMCFFWLPSKKTARTIKSQHYNDNFFKNDSSAMLILHATYLYSCLLDNWSCFSLNISAIYWHAVQRTLLPERKHVTMAFDNLTARNSPTKLAYYIYIVRDI